MNDAEFLNGLPYFVIGLISIIVIVFFFMLCDDVRKIRKKLCPELSEDKAYQGYGGKGWITTDYKKFDTKEEAIAHQATL